MNLAILQARMSSSRLPGKVLAPILGVPMIGRQLERLSRAARLDAIVVATSDNPSDDPLADYCAQLGRPVFRGGLADVLGRFHAALADWPQASTVVRLTADCPLADPGVIDLAVDEHLAANADYTSTNWPERTFPHGLDAEVVRRDALETAWREAADAYEREHVTPFIYRRPERFRLRGVTREPPRPELRWTVDYPDDLAFVRGVYSALYPGDPGFDSDAVMALPSNSAPLPKASVA